jgi:hypothetical protein
MSRPPCNQPSARIADVLDLALDRARDLKQVVIHKLTKLRPRHWVWFSVGALLLGGFVEIVERYVSRRLGQSHPIRSSPVRIVRGVLCRCRILAVANRD